MLNPNIKNILNYHQKCVFSKVCIIFFTPTSGVKNAPKFGIIFISDTDKSILKVS